jgi:carboxypeptidase Taq
MMSDSRPTNNAPYESLLDHLRKVARVTAIHEQLAWDELTLLPDAATEYRGQQLAYLAGLQHELNCDPRLDEWLAAIDETHEPAATRINVVELRRRHALSKQLPKTLVEELARVTTTAQHEWALAREADDFGRFGIWLERVIKLKREQARCWTAGTDLYEPLVAEYEPGLDYQTINATLAELSSVLPELVQQRLSGQKPARGQQPLQGSFAVAPQRALCEQLAKQIGFDFRRGRLDTAVHPFTTHISADDCRIAIRFNEQNLAPVISVSLHELGHALYDQGVPTSHFGEPVGEPISLSVHESQARLWENAVGRSLGFWRFLLPQIEAAFPATRGQWTAQQIVAALSRIAPGTNRVEADETTYNLHILLRVELERALLSGDLTARDLPAAWNDAYQRLLGVTPGSDREGCLQDGHWAAGMFGYFPTYTLGNVLMAQLFERITLELGPLDEQFAQGEFQSLHQWLQKNLFSQGKLLSTAAWAQQLSTPASTNGLDLQPLLKRLAGSERSAV